MTHLLHLLPAAAAALCRRRAPAPLPYPPPDAIPPGWLPMETRWDCQRCAGVQPAVVRRDHFRCLTCQTETPLIPA